MPQDKPLTPGQPYFQEDTHTFIKFLTWQSNDPSVTKFELQIQYLQENSTLPQNETWSLVYEDISSEWPVSGLKSKGLAHFRVRAVNQFGVSDWSQESSHVDLEQF